MRQVCPRQRLSGVPKITARTAPSLPDASRSWPLRQELVDLEDITNTCTSTRHYVISGGSAKVAVTPYMIRPRSWIQELAAQNILFNSLPAMINEYAFEKEKDLYNTPCISDGDGDADEEDNVEEIINELEEMHTQENDEGQESSRSQETDDEDSSFEPNESGYVFVNTSRQIGTVGSWNELRAWNGTVRRGSRFPSPVGEGSEIQ